MIYFEDLQVGAETDFGIVRGHSRGSARLRAQVRSAALSPIRRGGGQDALRPHRGERLAHGRNDHGRNCSSRRRAEQAGLGSPGIDELRWKKPVYPGDTLHVRGRILEKKPSRSRPEMGSFRTETTVTNQDGDVRNDLHLDRADPPSSDGDRTSLVPAAVIRPLPL